MKCTGKDTHESAAECPDCYGDGEVYCFDCQHYRACRECDGTGERDITSQGHLVPCEVCDNADALPEHIAEWIATKQLASIDKDTQRGIVELHNRGLLVYPPRVLDYGETAFCVALAHSFKRMAKLITEVVPGAKPVALDELALPSGIAGTKLADHGIWVLIETTPPTHKEVLAYVRELNAEARHAA